MKRLAASLVIALGASALAVGAPTLSWSQVAVRAHDGGAFTQGLVAHGGVLLEGTGRVGGSSLRRVDPLTGRVLMRTRIAPPLYAEGITVLRGVAYQLTWMDHKILEYAPRTLTFRRMRHYPHDGWGLTTDGRSLIASDGTSTIRWMNPRTLRTTRSVTVSDGGQPVVSLNELEMIDGAIWANVWRTDRIAIISPQDGHVRAWLDLFPLDPLPEDPDAVLNGIAIDPVTTLPIVTGKLWFQMSVIRLNERVPA